MPTKWILADVILAEKKEENEMTRLIQIFHWKGKRW